MAGLSQRARLTTVHYIGAAVLLLIVSPPFLTSYWVGLLTQMIIFAILAMSLDILLGYTGLPSLGHAGIFGVAAYVVAVLSTAYQRRVLGLRGERDRWSARWSARCSGCWSRTCGTCIS